MKVKWLILLAFLPLAGCGDPNEATRNALAAAEEKASDNGRVECAPAGTAGFESVCTLQRVQGAEGTTLTIIHPDGGFRRLLVTTDGRGVVAADGAEQAKVSIVGEGRIEVEVAGDRYRLPATVKGGG